MTTPHPIGVIGLGVMGQRMLQRLAEHPLFTARIAWDPDPAAIAATRRLYPDVAIAADAGAVAATPGLEALYIASPPVAHLDHAERGFDAGLAVFCEKPLTVDFPAGRRIIERIARDKPKAAVNFSMAASPGLAGLQAALADGSIGTLQRVEIDVVFERWPRTWQAAAGAWLSERIEGGFTREVLSHFVFTVQRLLGPARVATASPVYPPDGRGAETSLTATLEARGVPVAITGRVGGRVAESNRMTMIGTTGKAEIFDWTGLRRCGADNVWISQGNLALNRQQGQVRQLDALAELIKGRPNVLPDFAEALAVQETIEAMLRPGAAA